MEWVLTGRMSSCHPTIGIKALIGTQSTNTNQRRGPILSASTTGFLMEGSIHHYNHNNFTALFQDHSGEMEPEENFWTLWCKGRLTEADTPTIRMGATPSGSVTSAHLHHPPYLYTGRMPFLPPNQQRQNTEGN